MNPYHASGSSHRKELQKPSERGGDIGSCFLSVTDKKAGCLVVRVGSPSFSPQSSHLGFKA